MATQHDRLGETVLIKSGGEVSFSVIPGEPYIDPSARLGQGVTIDRSAVIGENAVIGDGVLIGPNAIIGAGASIGNRVIIGPNVIIEPDAQVEDDISLDYNVIVRRATRIGRGTRIGANAVVGQAPSKARTSTLSAASELPPLRIGEECQICVGAIVYAGTEIGPGCFIADGAQVRERCRLGRNVIIGHGSTVENDCTVGDNTKIQTGVYIVALSVLEEHVFVAPMVTTTNDNFVGRTEERFKYRKGVTVRKGGRIGGNAVILPGVTIGQEALVAAGSVVTKDVPPYKVVMGVPARVVRDVPPEQVIFPRED